MEKNDTLTRVLATIGTALAWFPVLAPIALSLTLLIVRRTFRFDYLMPAELFAVALVGGGLLMWAALRARSRRGLVGWSLAIAVGSLVGSQALAVVTGLASGDTEPVGWPWALVLGLIAVYWLALIAVGIGGALLMRDLFKSPQGPTKLP